MSIYYPMISPIMIPINNIVPYYSYNVHIWMQKYHVISPSKIPNTSPLQLVHFPRHAAPHGRRSLTIWTCYWTRRGLGMGGFFWVKHGKTNHFKGKILGMIYIYKVGIDPSNVFLYIPSIFPLRYIFIVG